MSEKPIEKAEKAQYNGIINKDKVMVYEKEAIEEFYKNSYIGTIEKDINDEECLLLDPVEVLLLIERNRLLLYPNNNHNNNLLDFEGLLVYFSNFDSRLWQKSI